MELAEHLGLKFDGRIAEDFKLATGTFVSVGPLRGKIIAAGAPYIQDVVLTGLNMKEVGAMVFPTPRVRELAGLPDTAPLADVLAAPAVLAHMQKVVNELAATSTGSANSSKQHERQMVVAQDIAEQISGGSHQIFGVMIESHIQPARILPKLKRALLHAKAPAHGKVHVASAIGDGRQVHCRVMEAVPQNRPKELGLRVGTFTQQLQSFCGWLFEHALDDGVGLATRRHVIARGRIQTQDVFAHLLEKACAGLLT